jgi:hypothetical protein
MVSGGVGSDCQWDMMIVYLTDPALVTRLYKLFDILVEEQPPESFQKLHPHGIL